MLKLLEYNNIDINSAMDYDNQMTLKTETQSHQNQKGQKAASAERLPFTLPPRDKNMKRAFAYLGKTRHIPGDIISFFAHEQKIYQADESHYQNIVFVGHNENQEPVYATKRSASDRAKFRGEVAGSNKGNYCFNYFPEHAKEPKQFSGHLNVFEAPIDMLSYIAFAKGRMNPGASKNSYTWQNDSYLALGGIASGSLFHYLDSQGDKINTITLALDKDAAGINATADILLELTKRYPEICVDIKFPKFKDWNQDLTTTAIVDLKHGDVCTLPNYNSDTIKIFSNSESMAYKLAESKHLSGAERNPLASFFVLEENLDGGSLRKYLNERYRSENPIKEINFYVNNQEPDQWCEEVGNLVSRASKAGINATIVHYKMEYLGFDLLNTVNINPADLLNKDISQHKSDALKLA